MMRIVTTDDLTGHVIAEWSGGDEQTLAPEAGRTHWSVPDDGRSYSGQRWTGTAFEPIPPAPVRVLTPIDFARRFTMAEETAIDALSESNRIVSAWMRRLSLAESVNLDHRDVVAGLAYLKSVGIPSVWPDAETANARIAAIRA